MNRKSLILILFLIFCFLFPVTDLARADTIRTNDGKELKGIVVEDYKDRAVFSTADGEITVMKSDIRELYFDSEEDNLISLAEQAKARRDYEKAYAYYNMAFKANPYSKAAKDGLVFLQGYLFRQEEAKKEDEVKRRDEFERYGPAAATENMLKEEAGDAAEGLKESAGMALALKDGIPEVSAVAAGSPAYEAGIRKGDRLVSIWGRLTGYTPLKEVIDRLTERSSLEIKCAIERTIEAGVKPDIGASFVMEFDGLTVSAVKDGGQAFEAGLEKGDLIVAIDGNSARYIPLKKAVDLIKDQKKNSVKLTLRRDTLIWRRR